ncbi:unnamed protein product [Sordaria macrospora k-hell]|uniref:WGS project CABT00000000 data, contig 2.56 n=1 Tax=Sordaria macrospora (strain ATCC MYA-333 / DSM 997 / K(L3346) / K-hell) TaxID=771870 RepID=F7WA04_SORMK|nr:uncharacterized protein SMAC_08282 [Sordaria macrospora k-hell]CCC05271.1 unnamed protein product [Sordaria macrospora k-hell]
MSFLNLNLSYQSIHFRHPSSSSSSPIHLPTLPSGISRSFIPTALGDLEIVHTSPSQQSQPALFFIHGGMGSASVWLEYLSFFSAALQEQQIPCYAVSMRGHGGSWYPSYLRMVYGTTKGDLAGDVVEGIKWAADRERERRKVWEGERRNADNVEERENREVEMILVGHSSGGGLAQYILSAGLLDGLGVKIKGLVLMGAVPGFGSLPVYLNWFRLDPLFTLRMILHGWHPNSPLSHPSLVRRIFFSDQLPESYLLRFMSFMNRYESFLWPLGDGLEVR